MATFNFTTVRKMDVAGIRRRVLGVLTGGASYVEVTGEVITAADLGLGVIERFDIGIIDDASAIYWPMISYNAARTQVTLFWYSATGTAVGNGDVSDFSGTFEAVGK